MSDWILSKDHVHAIREARAAIRAAAATGAPAAIEGAIAAAVRVMWAADFSRTTICSLVGAAVDTGLPRRRGYAQRAADVEFWTLRAGVLADALVDDEARGWPPVRVPQGKPNVA